MTERRKRAIALAQMIEPTRIWLFTASEEELRLEIIPSQVQAVLSYRARLLKKAA